MQDYADFYPCVTLPKEAKQPQKQISHFSPNHSIIISAILPLYFRPNPSIIISAILPLDQSYVLDFC